MQGRRELNKYTEGKQSNRNTCGNSNKTAKVRITYHKIWIKRGETLFKSSAFLSQEIIVNILCKIDWCLGKF